ncbi:hypothetical protein B0H16DRAFT_1859001 [Mycena metata]|uniref:Uncharacterized protein n=1 Tax=Mycena metata TaxID=1033252 RepID=A0AAD7K161_9AGAR|nr:hypothetical protein B0H16DRAFT_1859001 [Mycena metata]
MVVKLKKQKLGTENERSSGDCRLASTVYSAKDSSGEICWAWVAEFVAFESAKSKQAGATDAPARMRHLSIAVDGCVVLPLALADLKQATLQEILNMPSSADTDTETTWVFSNTQMDNLGAELFKRVQEEEVRMKIPVYGVVKDGRYPYEAVISDVAPLAQDGRRPCKICKKIFAGTDCQNHMGKHILLSQRGIVEPNIVNEVAKQYPCGFCGQAIAEGCTISISSGKAISTCSEAYPFMVKAALKTSGAKPCTNAPMKCSLCLETHWKYSMGVPEAAQMEPEGAREEAAVGRSVCRILQQELPVAPESSKQPDAKAMSSGCSFCRREQNHSQGVNYCQREMYLLVRKWEVAVLPLFRIEITDLASSTSYLKIQRSIGFTRGKRGNTSTLPEVLRRYKPLYPSP